MQYQRKEDTLSQGVFFPFFIAAPQDIKQCLCGHYLPALRQKYSQYLYIAALFSLRGQINPRKSIANATRNCYNKVSYSLVTLIYSPAHIYCKGHCGQAF